MHHRSISAILLLAAGVSCAISARAATDTTKTITNNQTSYARVVRLSLVDGAVSIAHAGESNWQPALANMPIQEGDTLASASGFAEVEFENGCVAYLAANSTLQFTKLSLENGGRMTEMTLTQGTASFYASPASQDSFEASTPDLTAAVPDKSEFRMDATTAGSSVSVYQGAVNVSSSAGTNPLAKGETLTFHADNNQGVSVAKNAAVDAFDRWVNSQTQVTLAATQDSQGYLSVPYSYGLADLDGYGSWLDCGGLGTCWAPMGMSAGWMPYADGFWSPFDGLGMTWISYEPWGWMPYHFGGWEMSPMYGWVWVPGQMSAWQPAMVAWVQSGGQVGWVPLAPNDKIGQTPINLQHGFVVNPAATTVGAAAVNHVVAVGVGHATTVIARPPAGFVSAAAPSMARTATPGAGFAGRGGPQTVVFDRATHAFVNAPASAAFRAPENSGVRNTFRTAPAPASMPSRSYGGPTAGGPNGGYHGQYGGGNSSAGRASQGNSAPMNSAPRSAPPSSSAPAAAAPSAGSAGGHH
ncbi:MAG: FecR family protein [Candidatus Acidiferrales bacterium]